MTVSPFSNPAAGAADAGAAYTRALLEMLGDREALDVLGELPQWIATRLAGVDDELSRRPEAPGKWSALDLLRHLVDTELVNGYRIRVAIEQDRPPVRGYDQDAWVRLFGVAVPGAADGIEMLRVHRNANLRIWRSLDAAQLERVALHEERGPESVGHLLRLLGGHDLVHRRQMDRILG